MGNDGSRKADEILENNARSTRKISKNAFLRQFSTRINHVAWVSPHLEVKQYIFMHSDSIKFISSEKATNFCNKAELPLEGISFCTQFPSLGIFINKKVGFRKN